MTHKSTNHIISQPIYLATHPSVYIFTYIHTYYLST